MTELTALALGTVPLFAGGIVALFRHFIKRRIEPRPSPTADIVDDWTFEWTARLCGRCSRTLDAANVHVAGSLRHTQCGTLVLNPADPCPPPSYAVRA